jgi:exosortase family protein XrtF
MNWKEFKPTLFFLARFLGLYLSANLLYGWFVTTYEPAPDPITQVVTQQSAAFLSAVGWPSAVVHRETRPTSAIIHQQQSIVTVYEGCNGINVMIIFVAFVVAFGPQRLSMVWFIPLGILIIHVFNLARIILLFWVTLELPRYLYFSHKYLFTAFIYAVVLALWMVWVKYFSRPTYAEE